MKHTLQRCLPAGRTALFTLLALIVLMPATQAEGETYTTFFLRPHCDITKPTLCATFEAASPDTLRTPLLASGALLDLDLVLTNPTRQSITRARAWISFNPKILQGVAIDLNPYLVIPTPGEKNFSPFDGLVKIEAGAISAREPNGIEIPVARIRFKVISVLSTGEDVLSFYDTEGPTGHTKIYALGQAGGAPVDILDQKPGSLLLSFSPATPKPSSSSSRSSTPSSASAQGSSETSSSSSSVSSSMRAAASSTSTSSSSLGSSVASAPINICGNGMVETGEECDDGNFLNGDGCNIYCTKEVPSSRSSTSSTSSSPSAARPDGSICVSDKECESGLCSRGICRGNVLKIEDGGICNTSDQCIGLSCVNNKCTTLSSSSSSQPSPGAQTSFSLLQIRNLRVTTEGGSVFLAWEPLVSSQIKAYNVYYGATSGRYLQRKTVDAASSTITLRSLPQNTQYYFAVRALSNADEESAFSQEVGIVVGKPSTSTAPLTSNVMATKIESRSIVKVQGDTGLPIILTFALVLSAVIGTAYALKRQCTALSYPR